MRRRAIYAIGFIVIVLILMSSFFVASNGDFGGADDKAEGSISEINPEYKPWFSSIWEPPGETESLLFALQAAIGALIIGYFIGRYLPKKNASI